MHTTTISLDNKSYERQIGRRKGTSSILANFKPPKLRTVSIVFSLQPHRSCLRRVRILSQFHVITRIHVRIRIGQYSMTQHFFNFHPIHVPREKRLDVPTHWLIKARVVGYYPPVVLVAVIKSGDDRVVIFRLSFKSKAIRRSNWLDRPHRTSRF
jgi:hypothetical protein